VLHSEYERDGHLWGRSQIFNFLRSMFKCWERPRILPNSKKATLTTTFNFKTKGGKLGYDIDLKPIEISRSRGPLRFQDWLIPHDQYLMDLNPDEYRSR
jgi:hypothetical protein